MLRQTRNGFITPVSTLSGCQREATTCTCTLHAAVFADASNTHTHTVIIIIRYTQPLLGTPLRRWSSNACNSSIRGISGTTSEYQCQPPQAAATMPPSITVTPKHHHQQQQQCTHALTHSLTHMQRGLTGIIRAHGARSRMHAHTLIHERARTCL